MNGCGDPQVGLKFYCNAIIIITRALSLSLLRRVYQRICKSLTRGFGFEWNLHDIIIYQLPRRVTVDNFYRGGKDIEKTFLINIFHVISLRRWWWKFNGWSRTDCKSWLTTASGKWRYHIGVAKKEKRRITFRSEIRRKGYPSTSPSFQAKIILLCFELFI